MTPNKRERKNPTLHLMGPLRLEVSCSIFSYNDLPLGEVPC